MTASCHSRIFPLRWMTVLQGLPSVRWLYLKWSRRAMGNPRLLYYTESEPQYSPEHVTLGSHSRWNGNHFVDDIFKLFFLCGNWCILIHNWPKFISMDLIHNKSALIGSDNGLSQNRWQAIIWTNDGLVYWRIYVSMKDMNKIDQYQTTIKHQKKRAVYISKIHCQSQFHRHLS